MIDKLAFYDKINDMNRKGFTLVEIMFVTFIIAFLLSIAVVQGVKLRKSANESNVQANLKSIGTSFEIYAAGNGGLYAPGDMANLQFLVDARCAPHDFISIGQVGNFRYVAGSITPIGYDIRAMAINSVLADHNYQVLTGGMLLRSDTSGAADTDFKNY
ncbi:MAG: prepilin-type N-terminal cleavage/methylation domain-containing protein [Candidatus Omnitrophota bacterium]|jgi:prepilin-type N-terminal cleavage/methylation domain-containing protein